MIFAKTIVVLCTAAAVMAASCRSQNKFSNWGMGRSRTSVMMKTVRCECGDTNTHEDDEWTGNECEKLRGFFVPCNGKTGLYCMTDRPEIRVDCEQRGEDCYVVEC
ncbi:MAG: hypothetical protein BYD32DRAFT_428358 [Podila humilis]|nr:MAG: hypothetical protein BYD32DRAFT_428358 [Podila humilis]